MHACLIVPIALLLSGPASAQVVSGRVVARDSTPVAAAKVRLIAARGDTLAVVTDALGRFRFATGPGEFHLAASADGLHPVLSPAFELGRGDSLVVRVRMSPDSVTLRPLEVVVSARRQPGWLRAFYRRADQNAFGWFLTREQIGRANAFRTSDLLWAAPGITLVPGRAGSGYVLLGRGGCIPSVYLDGMRLRGGAAVDEWTTPMDIEAIEVYTDGGVPAEFMGRASGCAVVAIWTRAGG